MSCSVLESSDVWSVHLPLLSGGCTERTHPTSLLLQNLQRGAIDGIQLAPPGILLLLDCKRITDWEVIMLTRVSPLLFVCLAISALNCSEQRPLSPSGTVSPVHAPWENEEAENLAWLVSGEVYATKIIYDRIRSDLMAIRSRWGDTIPQLRSINHVPWSQPRLVLYIDQQVREEMISGTYNDWDSLNSFYGAHATPTLAVVSDNRVNVRRMVESYKNLRGITNVEPSPESGDRSNVYAYLHPWGIGYVFRVGWGDCFVSCIWSEVHYFRSTNTGISFVGTWQVDIDSPSQPDWWSEALQAWDLYRFEEVDKQMVTRKLN